MRDCVAYLLLFLFHILFIFLQINDDDDDEDEDDDDERDDDDDDAQWRTWLTRRTRSSTVDASTSATLDVIITQTTTTPSVISWTDKTLSTPVYTAAPCWTTSTSRLPSGW